MNLTLRKLQLLSEAIKITLDSLDEGSVTIERIEVRTQLDLENLKHDLGYMLRNA